MQTTPADYTIVVDNLPNDVGAEELGDYFERVLSNWDAGMFTEEEVRTGRKAALLRRHLSVSSTLFPGSLRSTQLQNNDHKVAEVVIHRAFASVLNRSLKIAEKEKQLHVMVTEMASPPQSKLNKLQGEIER